MRKKLDTRFPAARIKKIMQTDEDVGKIALAVPLLVSKALELFLQDLCDRSYEITLEKGAKTMNSLHLKQCVHRFNMFDFLKDTVSKVPDLGVSEASGEDRSATKRRKAVDDEETDSDEELKRSKMHDSGHSTSSGVRGRGRGRGRGRPRGSGRTQQRVKFEDCSDMSKHNENGDKGLWRIQENHSEATVLRNFDLNVDLTESRDSPPPLPVAPPPPAAAAVAPPPPPAVAQASPELKHEEYPGWSMAEIEKMAIDPVQLVGLNRTNGEEDEDYDEEEG